MPELVGQRARPPHLAMKMSAGTVATLADNPWHDTDGFVAAGDPTNPIVIPPGLGGLYEIEIGATIDKVAAPSEALWCAIAWSLNGVNATEDPGAAALIVPAGYNSASPILHGRTLWADLVPGDALDLRCYLGSAGALGGNQVRFKWARLALRRLGDPVAWV